MSPTAVLLSQFDMWHAALNDVYLGFAQVDGEESGLGARTRGIGRQELEKSWEAMFDLESGDPRCYGELEERAIQAAAYEFRMEDVKEITHFVAR